LVFNYLGHGGEDGLSAERIWEKSDGQNLSNQYKYPLFITITCEFSRFDNPSNLQLVNIPIESKGGAIAMITNVPSDSLALKILMMHSLKTILFASQYTSIAEALRIAKNSNQTALNVVFYLGSR
jgi:hypothetical protein